MIRQKPAQAGPRNESETSGGITPEDRQAYYELHLMRLARLVLFHRQLLEEIKNKPGWKPEHKPTVSDDDDDDMIPVSLDADDIFNIYRSAQRSLSVYYQQTKKGNYQIKPWLEEMTQNALKDTSELLPERRLPGIPTVGKDEKKHEPLKGQPQLDKTVKTATAKTTPAGKKKGKKDRLVHFSDEYHKALSKVVHKDH
ncbi:MAG: hypothetical protein LWY06_02710 [Firmicutes bacterium]|nr:hypothetical protein [Bacillota bacterium]